MEKLGWLQIGQHQLQQDVTHGLAFVLVDGRDNELDFADLGSSMWASFQSDTKQ